MYEIYCLLRDKMGVKDAAVAKATGIGRSTFSDWKNGRSSPKAEKLQKIADYFGVSVDYLQYGKTDQEGGYYLNKETAQAAQELFENKEMRILFDAARNSRPEDLRMAADLLERLKGTNPDA